MITVNVIVMGRRGDMLSKPQQIKKLLDDIIHIVIAMNVGISHEDRSETGKNYIF